MADRNSPLQQDARPPLSLAHAKRRTSLRNLASRRSASHYCSIEPACSPSEAATSGRRGLPGKLLTVNDPAFRQVVRGHLDVNSVADDRPNAVATHFAGRVGDDAAIVVEQHAK